MEKTGETSRILEILDLSLCILSYPMEYPCVTLRTSEETSFLWDDGFEGVTNAELEALHRKSRDTLLSIEAEIERRRLPASGQPLKINKQCDDLRNGFNRIGVQERLDDKAAKHAKAAVEILTTEQSIRPFKIYKAFLRDVLRHCGPEQVLLCAACLGKPKIASLKSEDRVTLLDHLKAKKSTYSSPILGRLAIEYHVPQLSATAGLDDQQSLENCSTGLEDGSHIESRCVGLQLRRQEQPASRHGPSVPSDMLKATTIHKRQMGRPCTLPENEQDEAPGANGELYARAQ